jgi:hypothetical protein
MGAEIIGSWKWRLNNLYHVVDEQGQDCLFRMRPAQERFFDSMHYYNIVLKARQLGFTTLIDLIGLDMVLFRKNFTAVIIAETKEKAADIFERKVIYPYEHLPQELKDWCPVATQSKDGEMSFGNGSMIKVMVSARSGTCQFLHVSEYGPVCAKQPAKAREVKTGSFPAVHAGGYCFVESTAMGNSGYFYEMVQQANVSRLTGRELSIQEFMLHFFPWHENAEYTANPASTVIPSRLLKYFDELYSRHGIALTEEQMAWYAIQENTMHEDMWAEFPSYVDEAFKVAQDGSYYARCFQDIYRTNRICSVPYDGNLPVFTAWDLGMSDQTSIWFFQFYGKEIRVIDFYENNGEGLGHYAAVLHEKGYRYGRHFAPHDIAVRELSSGVSRLETARKLGINFDRIPTNVDVAGGIENCREMLAYCWFDEVKTDQGRKCLEAYKKEWDEKHAVYKTQPLHDWASHGADAFRTGAQAWKMGLCGEVSNASSRIHVTGGLRRI